MPSNVVSGPRARLEEPNELVQIRSYEAHDVVKPVNKEDACGVFQPQSQPGNVQSPEAWLIGGFGQGLEIHTFQCWLMSASCYLFISSRHASYERIDPLALLEKQSWQNRLAGAVFFYCFRRLLDTQKFFLPRPFAMESSRPKFKISRPLWWVTISTADLFSVRQLGLITKACPWRLLRILLLFQNHHDWTKILMDGLSTILVAAWVDPNACEIQGISQGQVGSSSISSYSGVLSALDDRRICSHVGIFSSSAAWRFCSIFSPGSKGKDSKKKGRAESSTQRHRRSRKMMQIRCWISQVALNEKEEATWGAPWHRKLAHRNEGQIGTSFRVCWRWLEVGVQHIVSHCGSNWKLNRLTDPHPGVQWGASRYLVFHKIHQNRIALIIKEEICVSAKQFVCCQAFSSLDIKCFAKSYSPCRGQQCEFDII